METSEQINELAAALAAAQGQIQTVAKTGENTFFKKANGKGSSYATLADCVRATNAHLSANKLCFIQGVHGHEFVARLAHASGQWLQIRVPIPGDISKMNAQQLGSATTYLRRQTYSLVGLAPDEDDDGNEAAKAGTFKGKADPMNTLDPLDTLASRNWKDDPKGPLEPSVEVLAMKYAGAFLSAITPKEAHAVEADMNNERDDKDEPWGDILKMSVWAKIDSANRARIKKLLGQKAAA
jgi:hypothetical protein